MRGKPTNFWAKLRFDAGSKSVLEWHPLADHCADVGAVAEALLSLPIWRRRLARLAGQSLSESTCARLCVLVTLHDIGKFNLGFQAKGRPELGATAGHVKQALGELFHPQGVFSCLHEFKAWGNATTALLTSSLCHHGHPYNSDHTEGPDWWQATWWIPRGNLNPRAGAEDLVARCRAWFPAAFTDGNALPESAPFSHAFAGLVMLADWIGSDTRFFPFSEADDTDRMDVARSRAHVALAALGLDIPIAVRRDPLRRNPFQRVAPERYVPRPSQAAMSTLSADENGSITILEAETGSGKTEAALARFVFLFEAGLVDGMYFALPTRSAATQMHRRVCEAAQRAFVAPPPVVLAVPGYLRVDDVEGTRLAPFEVLWPDHERLRYRAWAAENPKRYLAGAIVVGTIDQVLLSSLMVGHANLRATALLRHLLVVDEVHASDAYMTKILEGVLSHHLTAGGYGLLLSATLGAEARARLLRPGEPEPLVLPSFNEAERTPYPLITHRAEMERVISIGVDGEDRAVEINTQPWLEDPEALAAAAVAAGIRGAKVLVIRNTVKDCVRTQLALERLLTAGDRRLLFTCEGVPAPHHALFAPPDRKALDVALERRIGKDRSPGGCIVVATQTVQQSLDLDADILFSDLCPVDVFLQRLGRLHRHRRTRPEGFERPRGFVIVPRLRDLGLLFGDSGVPRNLHGLGVVYPDLRILEATWRLMEKHAQWRIPGMCRYLVERGVHTSVLAAIVQEGGPRWQAHANYVVGTERGHERQAELNMVEWSRCYAAMSFPNSVDQRITTRLGEGDRRVRFSVPVVGAFGHLVDEVVLRARWARAVPPDAEFAQNVSTVGGVTRFRFGDVVFVYDRLGLRPE